MAWTDHSPVEDTLARLMRRFEMGPELPPDPAEAGEERAEVAISRGSGEGISLTREDAAGFIGLGVLHMSGIDRPRGTK